MSSFTITLKHCQERKIGHASSATNVMITLGPLTAGNVDLKVGGKVVYTWDRNNTPGFWYGVIKGDVYLHYRKGRREEDRTVVDSATVDVQITPAP